MEIEKKALYNLLRMNWLSDPSLEVEDWQVADYRSLSTGQIFDSLKERGIAIDQPAFCAFANEVDTPEEITDLLLENAVLKAKEQDYVYLLLFELWRRLLPEKQCLTIFCDELDQQIFMYDIGEPSSAESIQDSIANLQMIMDENVDQGVKPVEIFDTVSAASCNDLESFLYDFIAEQIDTNHIAYATELYEGFSPYLKGSKWFELLGVRILELSDSSAAHDRLRKLIQRIVKDADLSFNLELLSFIVQGGDQEDFKKIVRKTIPILDFEEDLQDLLALAADYYRCLDQDRKEMEMLRILDERKEISLQNPVASQDPAIAKILKMIRER